MTEGTGPETAECFSRRFARSPAALGRAVALARPAVDDLVDKPRAVAAAGGPQARATAAHPASAGR